MNILRTLVLFAAFCGASVFADEVERDLESLCQSLNKAFEKRSWGKNPCQNIAWKTWGRSVQGRPLIYQEFGDPKAKNVTLIFSMVHSDEITPLYLGFEMARWATENLKADSGRKLILAPFVNPDGFFNTPKTRTNVRGVDCNRNFPTQDWDRDALRVWKSKYRSDPRRFPGHQAESEPETKFQISLIQQFKPQKILSIHSPLNVIDYDGPDHLKLKHFSEEYIKKCEELRNRVRAKTTGFFPGSLGNYSGQDLGIPTITLELPTAQANHAVKYWRDFQKGMVTVIHHEIGALHEHKK